ncbi:hypothetical protein SmJEL517_g04057 [Synchytrium microbalum]|uniref:Rab-GAP TBC domain-containing protein n=1 Tax=Synchytrium microbalum TaxID=1806994 RepID=A0A507C0H5_9FUNG|nr:uncharacterized protein SmJEL517_g04057 [Synchytrium microbalum]TPX32868.1 hypothetical protein SmJEL517_g04057 [Synchytrium microbalum]
MSEVSEPRASSSSSSSGGVGEWRRIHKPDNGRPNEKDLQEWQQVDATNEINIEEEEDMTEISVPPEEEYVSIDAGYVASLVDESTVERDRYGFKKTFDAINKDTQSAFDLKYEKLLLLREKDWRAFLTAKDGAVKLPAKDNKLKRLVRLGIPRAIRGQCWYHYSGADIKRRQYPSLYAQLCAQETLDLAAGHTKEVNKIIEHIDIVDRDLLRTFPENVHFRMPPSPKGIFNNLFKPNSSSPTPYLESMRRVLVAFAYYSWPHPDPKLKLKHSKYNVGYCQSLNFVVGMLLLGIADGQPLEVGSPSILQQPAIDPGFTWSPVTSQREVETRAFWILAAAVDDLLPPEMYGSNLEGVQIEQDILWQSIMGKGGRRYGVGKVAKFIGNMEKNGVSSKSGLRKAARSLQQNGGHEPIKMPPLSMVTTQWFLTIFVNVVPTETLMRIWDMFFYQGEKNLMRVTLTLLKIHGDDLTKIEDPMEAWRFVKDMGKFMYDCENLMEICFKSRFSTKSTSSPTNMANGNMSSSISSGSSSGRISSSSPRPSDSDVVDQSLQPQQRTRASTDASSISTGSNKAKLVRTGVGSIRNSDLEMYREQVIAQRRKQMAKGGSS